MITTISVVLLWVGILLMLYMFPVRKAEAISPDHLETLIKDTLKQYIGEYAALPNAVKLMMMIAAHESKGGYYLTQKRGGPARGIFQLEKETEWDLFVHFIRFNDRLRTVYHRVSAGITPYTRDLHQRGNLVRQIVLARIYLMRFSQPIPPYEDDMALAKYVKKYWNTYEGKATASKILEDYYNYIGANNGTTK